MRPTSCWWVFSYRWPYSSLLQFSHATACHLKGGEQSERRCTSPSACYYSEHLKPIAISYLHFSLGKTEWNFFPPLVSSISACTCCLSVSPWVPLSSQHFWSTTSKTRASSSAEALQVSWRISRDHCSCSYPQCSPFLHLLIQHCQLPFGI